MILIIAHKEDYTSDFLINKLNIQGTPYIRLNCEDLLSEPLYKVTDTNGFSFNIAGQNPILSVWFRRTKPPRLDGLSFAQQIYFYREFDALLENIYNVLDNCKWLSSPFAIKQAESKLFQLRLAQRLGLTIPKTLVTNSKEELKVFFSTNYKTIIKPLYSGYVPEVDDTALFFTSIITTDHIQRLESFDLTPCIYQAYVEKSYELRVTVVDQQVFAARVNSQGNPLTVVDWRRSKERFERYELPIEIRDKCVHLCSHLGLHFGAIDLIRNTDGEYVFLEINPNGQWAWIEMETGLDISNAIVNFLMTNKDD